MEEQVRFGVERLRLLVKALAALVIAVGVAIAIIGLIRHAIAARGSSFAPIRLAFARYLTLVLELQLAADILSTSVAPTWERIGKLAAIAIIRTALNYFLSPEIEAERRSQHGRLQDRTWSPSDLRAGRGLLNRGIGLRTCSVSFGRKWHGDHPGALYL